MITCIFQNCCCKCGYKFMREHLVSKCACDVRKQSESSTLRLFVAEELDMQKQNGRTGPYAVSENAKL